MISAQSLSEYKWKNRLLVVFTSSDKSNEFQNQVQELNKEIQGVNNRRLKLIHALPEKHQIILPNVSKWEDSKLYSQMREEKTSDFEIILIGLDGGVKLRQKEILKTKKLFDLIDSMPMRQAKLRKNK